MLNNAEHKYFIKMISETKHVHIQLNKYKNITMNMFIFCDATISVIITKLVESYPRKEKHVFTNCPYLIKMSSFSHVISQILLTETKFGILRFMKSKHSSLSRL